MGSLLNSVIDVCPERLPVRRAASVLAGPPATPKMATAETILAADWHQYRLQQRRLQLAQVGDLAGMCAATLLDCTRS